MAAKRWWIGIGALLGAVLLPGLIATNPARAQTQRLGMGARERRLNHVS